MYKEIFPPKLKFHPFITYSYVDEHFGDIL